MPDAPPRSPVSPPVDWGEAFAALPMEAPPAPGWPRVASALDARARVRWPLWLATAAALALVALVPLKRWQQEEQADARAVTTSGAPSPEASPVARQPLPTAEAGVASGTVTSTTLDAPAATAAVLPRVRGNHDSRQPARIATASPTGERTMASGMPPGNRPRADAVAAEAATTSGALAAGGGAAAPAHAIEPVDATTTASTSPESTSPESTTPEIDRLHAESAQLEALVALARDDRMSTGTVAALGGELQARVARIDAALVEPALAPEQRLGLWRERVQALRELAGFETTQRLLAARGEQYDGMLVSVD